MKKLGKYILIFIAIGLICGVFSLNADRSVFSTEMPEVQLIQESPQPEAPQDVTPPDSTKPRFPVSKTVVEEYKDIEREYPMGLRTPENLKTDFQYDPVTNTYQIRSKIGNSEVTTPLSLTPEQYLEYSMQKSMQSYYRKKYEDEFSGEDSKKDPFSVFDMKFDLGPAEKIFGPGGVQLQTQGSATIKMAVNRTYTGDPSLASNRRTKLSFNFDEQIQANVNAKVGDKVNFGLNYNTESTFDFDTKKIKLAYQGKEDEILKVLEAGNVSMSTSNSLIRGGAALFGLKTELQFGKLRVGAIFSQQESQAKSASSRGGVQTTPFEITADAYEQNKHFFISQYFRDNYDRASRTAPQYNTSITIEDIEVWITNTKSNFNEARNFVAFSDLGESEAHISNKDFVKKVSDDSIPFNRINTLYDKILNDYPNARDISQVNQALSSVLRPGIDYEKVESARKLIKNTEYTVHTRLGYISLNIPLRSDEVLAVAFKYKIGAKEYQVGEFSAENPDKSAENLYLKLLKGTTLSPSSPYWDLMMKNIYSLNTNSLQQEKFRLDILYQNDTTGTYVNYLSEGNIKNQILLRVLGLDRLNSQQNPYPDGFFDFVEGATVVSQNGRIIFPVVEPFGQYLATKIGDSIIAKKYIYQELYDSTVTVAKQIAEKNKFILRGEYKGGGSGGSSGCDLSVAAMNVAPGSVRVTSNGVLLRENSDYTIDYSSGCITLLSDQYRGTTLNASVEDRGAFGMQRKTVMGLDLQYEFNKDFNIGATVMNMREMPITMKVNMGNESVNNTLYGFNANYKTQSQWLTNIVDKLPLLDLTAPSQISFSAEFAQLIPGHYQSKYGGNYSYIDDFEKTKVSLSLRDPYGWVLASTPGDNDLFPEAKLTNNLAYGNNRAMLAWYTIDPLFTRKRNSLTPSHLKTAEGERQLANPYIREVYETEIYPNKDAVYGEPTTLPVLNMAFYPNERGPYNLDAEGTDSDGKLKNPENRWGGMMRKIENSYSDFEASNIEYIEFWLLDPFIYKPDSKGGNLYINLGEISEDILKDEKKFYENGLPTDGIDTTAYETTTWGRVPRRQSISEYQFDKNPQTILNQDVGLNGLSSENEKSFPAYQNYLNILRSKLTPEAIARMEADPFSPFNDPAGDNYHYFRGSDYDNAETNVLDRYKRYNGTEGNSRPSEYSNERYDVSSKINPDVEDANNDKTLNENEKFFQYEISIKPEDLDIGKNKYIVDKRKGDPIKNDETREVNWYQFKIPVKDFQKNIDINDFKTIRFMRMYLRGFEDTVIMRFATLELVKGEWRAYTQDLSNPLMPPDSKATINIAAVNIEENSSREPVNYVLPPDVNRIFDPGQPQLRQENEQSLSLRVNNLSPKDARAVYKSTFLDTRQYKRLQMYVHAEKLVNDVTDLKDDDATVFLRLGSDYKNNYYEYEIPLKLTQPGLYNESSASAVWPSANMFNFPFKVLTDLKLKRNKEKRRDGSKITFQTVFSEMDPDNPVNTVSVVGNPSISEIKVIMIGIRNKSYSTKSVEVWVNELRLTEFNEDGGWAGNANLNIALSDLGTVNLTGRMETAGFGGLEQGIMERNLDDHYEYAVATTVELGKFFPEKANVSLPMTYGYAQQIVSPKYDPLNQDVLMKEALDAVETTAEKDSIKSYAQDKIISKNLSFNNVKVNVKSKNPMPYDPANFTLGYTYLENKKQNASTVYEKDTRTNLFFNYGYSPFIKPIEPFKSIKSKSGAVKLVKELGFNYLPNNFSFSSEMSRSYYEIQLRDLGNLGGENMIPASFREDFYWDRMGSVQWDLTKNLNMTMQTGTKARIESPYRQVNKQLRPDDYEVWKDSVVQSIMDLGTPLSYAQKFNATYNIPFKLIPVLDWVTGSLAYTGSYNWDKGATIKLDENEDQYMEMGNTIKNERVMGLNNAGFNLTTLYNKVPFLKTVNQKFVFNKPPTRPVTTKKNANDKTINANDSVKQKKLAMEKELRKKKFETEAQLNPDSATVVKHNLDNKQLRIVARGADGKLYEIKYKAIDNNSIKITNKDTAKVNLTIYQRPKMEETTWYKIAQVTTRGLMMVRNVNISYELMDGTMLPSFEPNIRDFFGQAGSDYGNAPGLDFAFGMAGGESYIDRATERGWLSYNTNNNLPAMYNKGEKFTLRAALEPFVGCRIDLNASRTDTRTEEIYFMDNGMKELSGIFNMTTIAIGTSFGGSNAKNNYNSATFEKFLQNREVILNRLVEKYNNTRYPNAGFISEYYPGIAGETYNPANGQYDINSADVLIPAFLAAYTGRGADGIGLSAFPSLKSLLPNWVIRYDGFMQMDIVNQYFKSFTLQHKYDCSYTVGNYTSYLGWVEANNADGSPASGLGFIRNQTSERTIPSSGYEIGTVNILEAFNPLIGLNAQFKNNTTLKLEMRKTRNVNLNIASYQIVESSTNNFIVGAGYKMTEFNKVLKMKANGGKNFSNDLTVSADISFQRMQSLIRKIKEAYTQATSGESQTMIKLSAKYNLSRMLTLEAFYDKQISTPLVSSTSFPTSKSSFGVSLNVSLTR